MGQQPVRRHAADRTHTNSATGVCEKLVRLRLPSSRSDHTRLELTRATAPPIESKAPVSAVAKIGRAPQSHKSLGRRSVRGALPRVGVEDALAQTERFGRRLDIFIRADVLDGTLETHPKRRFQLDALAIALAAHVGEMFRLARIDRQIVGPRVFTDNHSAVNFLLRPDEEAPALLNVVERVGGADSGLHRDHDAAIAPFDLTFEQRVLAKKMAHDPFAAGQVNKIAFETDEAARGDDRLDRNARRMMIHADNFAL